MIQTINPFTPFFVHTYIKTPFREGVARIQAAKEGVDLLAFNEQGEKPKISLVDRVISLATGLFLAFPLVGTIVWIAMKTFGHPRDFAPPFWVYQESPLKVPPPLLRKPPVLHVQTRPLSHPSSKLPLSARKASPLPASKPLLAPAPSLSSEESHPINASEIQRAQSSAPSEEVITYHQKKKGRLSGQASFESPL